MKSYILSLFFVFSLAGYTFGQVTLSYELRETIEFYKILISFVQAWVIIYL